MLLGATGIRRPFRLHIYVLWRARPLKSFGLAVFLEGRPRPNAAFLGPEVPERATVRDFGPRAAGAAGGPAAGGRSQWEGTFGESKLKFRRWVLSGFSLTVLSASLNGQVGARRLTGRISGGAEAPRTGH